MPAFATVDGDEDRSSTNKGRKSVFGEGSIPKAMRRNKIRK